VTLEVIHTVDRTGKPLAIVKNLPGLDAELRPERLRQLAKAIEEARSKKPSPDSGEQ